MRFPVIAALALAAGLLAASQAEAGEGYAYAGVTLRVGPGTVYAGVAFVPARAALRIYHCAAWCEVGYGVYRGYASAKFIAIGPDQFARHLTIAPVRTPAGRAYVPVYVKPQTAYISTTYSPCPYRWPTERIWYHDGVRFDRPDYFLIVER